MAIRNDFGESGGLFNTGASQTSGSLFAPAKSKSAVTGTSSSFTPTSGLFSKPQTNQMIPGITDDKRTSGTFGEVSKALSGSFGAGTLNMVGAYVGNMERLWAQGTSGEDTGLGQTLKNISQNIFSSDKTKRQTAATDIGKLLFKLTPVGMISSWLKPVVDNDEKTELFLNKTGGSQMEAVVKPVEQTVRKWADVENESGVTKFFAGIAESAPSSLATRIPYVGWFLMGNQVYRNTIEQTKAEYAAKGEAMPQGLGTLKALGYTAFELGAEMLFPLFGKVGAAVKPSLASATKGLLSGFFKQTGKQVAQSTLKTITKYIAKQAAQEGFEEVVTEFGQALVAKLTTNPDDPYWTMRDEDGGLVTFNSVGLAFLSGAVMGGGVAGVQSAAFARTQRVLKNKENKTVGEMTIADDNEIVDSLRTDLAENDNGEQDLITNGLTDLIGKVAENQGQTFETETGKIFTVPTNGEMSAATISPEAIREAIVQKNKAPVTAEQSIIESANTFTKNMKPQTVGEYTVSYNAKQSRAASVNVDTNELTLGRSYFAENVTPEKQREYIAHEVAHTVLKQQNITGADIVASGLFGKLGAVNAEEAFAQIASDLMQNPDFVSGFPHMSAANKARYAYVANVLAKVKPKTQTETPQSTEMKQAKTPKEKQPNDIGWDFIDEVEAENIAKQQPITKESVARSGMDVTEAAQAYVDSEEGQQEFAKFADNPDALANKVQDTLDSIVDNPTKFYHDKRFFEVELEIYRIFSEKLKKIPAGQDVNRYIVSIMRAVTSDKDVDVIKTIERSFKRSDLFHEVYTDKRALDEAAAITIEENKKYNLLFGKLTGNENKGIDEYAKKLVNSLTNDTIISKTDLVVIEEYVKRLYELPDGAGNYEAAKIAKKLTPLFTRMGQAIQGVSMLKKLFPEYHAEQIIKSYENALNEGVSQQKVKELEDRIEKLLAEMASARKDAGQNIGDTLDEAAKKAKGRTRELSVADLFAKRIHAMLTAKEVRLTTELQQKLRNLFDKYKEVISYKRSNVEAENHINLLAELVTNRDKYTEYWKEAQDILRAKEPIDITNEDVSREDFDKFYDEITNVDFIRKLTDRVVLDTVASMGTTIKELAQQYWHSGEETISGFADAIRTELAKSGTIMDTVSYDRMTAFLKSEFKRLMTARHSQDIENFIKRYDRGRQKKNLGDKEEQAIAKVIEAGYHDVFDETRGRVSQYWSQALGIPAITPEIRQIIYDAAKKMAAAKDDNQRNEIYEQMVMGLRENLPSTLHDKFTGWLRMSMLLTTGYLIRNSVTNIGGVPFYKATDALSNYFINNMKLPPELQIAGQRIEKYNPTTAIGKVVADNTTDAETKRLQSRLAKYSIAMLFGHERKLYKNKVLQAMNEITYEIPSTGTYKKFSFKPLGDLFMFQNWLRHSMYNIMEARGYNESMSAEEKQNIIDDAKERGAEIAAQRTWRARVMLASMFLNLQRAAQQHNNKAALIGLKIVTPFIVTPAAITSEAYKFSPLALAKALVVDYGYAKYKSRKTGTPIEAEHKAATAKKISQALVGTASQFMVGALLAATGLLTGKLPDDKDERKQWEAMGKKPYSIYIPGIGYFSIDWMQPFSTGVMSGAATFNQMFNSDTSVFNKIAAPFTSSFDVLFQNSLLRNVSQLFGGDYGQSTTGMGIMSDFGNNLLSQITPSAIKKLNKVLDPYERDIYSGDAFTLMLNRGLTGIPAGTYAIPAKIDVWGKPVKNITAPEPLGTVGRLVFNFISPFTFSQDKADSVTKEVTRVFNETSDAKALPSVMEQTITRTKDGKKTTWDLSPSDWMELQTTVGQQSHDAVASLIRSSSYSGWSDDRKAKELGKIYSKIGEEERDKYVSSHPK